MVIAVNAHAPVVSVAVAARPASSDASVLRLPLPVLNVRNVSKASVHSSAVTQANAGWHRLEQGKNDARSASNSGQPFVTNSVQQPRRGVSNGVVNVAVNGGIGAVRR